MNIKNYLKQKAIKWLDINIRLAEIYSTNDEDIGYRRITDKDVKGLDILTRDRQLLICYKLYLKNPFAKAILDTINDFVFGEGFSFEVISYSKKFPKYKLEQAKEVLNKFWENNAFNDKLEKKGIDLSLNGMLVLPTFVNNVNGEVKLGFVDPQNIDKVTVNMLDVEDIQQVKLKKLTDLKTERLFNVIKPVTDIFNERFGLLEGDCFFYSINNVSNQPEGVSDLLVTADMVDMLDSLLFNILKHSEASYLHFQDVTIDGADENYISQWQKTNPIPESGSRVVHNEKVKYELISPDIKANNSAEIVRLFKNIVLLSKRLPEHWFADGGNTNLATAVEQGTAIYKLIANRQRKWINILTDILNYVLHQAYIYKREGFTLTKDDLLNNIIVKVIAPEFEQKDIDKRADTINKITDALSKSVSMNAITEETAGKIIRSLLSLINYKIDEEVEIELLQQIKKEKQEIKQTEPEPQNNEDDE
jgi:hypothetical protein